MLPKEGSRVTVEVFVRTPPVCFESRVLSTLNHAVCIAAPTVNGRKVGVPVGTAVRLSSPTNHGVIRVTSSVERIQAHGVVHWVVSDPGISGIQHVDRRELSRIRVDLPIHWALEEGSEMQTSEAPMRLIDINSGGAQVKVMKKLELDQVVLLDLSDLLDEEEQRRIPRLQIPARVVRTANLNRYGLALGLITGETRALFLKMLHRLERNLLRESARGLMAMTPIPG